MVSDFDFSIVVPTYRRPEQLGVLLYSLTKVEYPRDRFEVILVDDGGEASLEPVVAPFRPLLNVMIAKQQNSGPAMARNRGADIGRGRVLAFTDDDCFVHPMWLKSIAKKVDNDPTAACGGKTVNALHHNMYSTATHLLMEYLFQQCSPQTHGEGFFPTNNFAVARKSFLELGGFDPGLRFGEDREFCYRWASAGNPFLYIPSAIVYHAHHLNLRSYMKLHFRYGSGSSTFRSRCRKKLGTKPKLNSFLFYINLTLQGSRSRRDVQGWILSLLLIISQFANASGYFWKAIRDDRSQFNTDLSLKK